MPGKGKKKGKKASASGFGASPNEVVDKGDLDNIMAQINSEGPAALAAAPVTLADATKAQQKTTDELIAEKLAGMSVNERKRFLAVKAKLDKMSPEDKRNEMARMQHEEAVSALTPEQRKEYETEKARLEAMTPEVSWLILRALVALLSEILIHAFFLFSQNSFFLSPVKALYFSNYPLPRTYGLQALLSTRNGRRVWQRSTGSRWRTHGRRLNR
jgi:hypothetical protein